MRYLLKGTSRDFAGNVIKTATISAFLAGTTTPASIYTAYSGGIAVNTVTSDTNGDFSFYVDDGDYIATQRFKITIAKTGYTTSTYDYISIFDISAAIDTDANLAANSDSKVASQKATKSYADTKTTLVAVKADSDVADAISKKHTQGTDTGTTGNSFAVGDGTAGSNKKILAQNADANKPYLSYDEASNSWVFSNDGSIETKMVGAGAVTFANAAEITTGTEPAKAIAPDQLKLSSPTFANITDSGLTASQMVCTDADKKLVSKPFTFFSGVTAPGNTVAGMWWYDTTAHILRVRNEDNTAWLSVWDLAANKPVVANLSNEITGTMISNTIKDAAATTASLRTLGTGATQAMPGNTVITPDGSVTEAKIVNGAVSQAKLKYAPGSVLLISSDAEVGDVSTGTWIKRKEIRVARTGTLRVSYDFKGNDDGYANIYRNGVAVGTQRTGNGSFNTYTEDIGGLVPGSLIQIYTYCSIGYGVLVRNFRLYTDSYQTEVVIM